MLIAVASAFACGGTSFGEAPAHAARLHGLSVAISGSGTVSSAPQGIDCGAVCAAIFDDGVSVVLNAHPAPGWLFSGWSGACAGAAASCPVTLFADATVSARFDSLPPPPPPTQRALTIVIAGQGRVTSVAGLDCSATCTTNSANGTRVVLSAAATSGWQFSGWSGACAGSDASCPVTLSADATVSARFDPLPPPPPPIQRTLTIEIAGQGHVTSPTGVDCSATCTMNFADGTRVALSAAATPGWQFSGWSGACAGAAASCPVTLSSDAIVSARFDPLPPPPPTQRSLTIEIAGQGRITSPAGLDCTATCTSNFADGTRVVLDAASTSGWQFSGWSGACAGTAASCTLTLTADAIATATFTPVPPPPAPVSVLITPASATLVTGGAARFTARVNGTVDQRVLWSVAEGQAGGSVDATGAYTAPATAGTYHVVAASNADPSSSAGAVVTVTSPPPPKATVAITPANIAAPSNAQWHFTAQVTGASDTSVTWSVREGDVGGSISGDGWYISPLSSGEYHVVATSNADPSASATALVRTDTPLTDQGGLVQPAAVVYAIWWGSASVFGDAPTQLATLFSGFEGSPYLRTLDQYMRGAKATVSFAGNLFDSSPAPSDLTTVEAEICGQLDVHNITPRQDGLYFVFFDNFPSGSSSSHGNMNCHGMTITIALVINVGAGAPPGQSPDVCGRSQMVDGFSLDAAHELFEAMANPRGRGWEDKVNAFAPEIGDKCASIPTLTCAVTLNNGSTWRLPYMWSNTPNQCVLETH